MHISILEFSHANWIPANQSHHVSLPRIKTNLKPNIRKLHIIFVFTEAHSLLPPTLWYTIKNFLFKFRLFTYLTLHSHMTFVTERITYTHLLLISLLQFLYIYLYIIIPYTPQNKIENSCIRILGIYTYTYNSYEHYIMYYFILIHSNMHETWAYTSYEQAPSKSNRW